MKIQEVLAPRKPDKVVSSTMSKSGMQGSKEKIIQRQFTTSSGNDVKVHFSPRVDDGEASTRISFYVNDKMSDESSTEGKDIASDFEILSGVMYITLMYLNRAKLNHCSFEAFAGEGDKKTKHNIPIESIRRKIIDAVDKMSAKLSSLVITPEMKQAALDQRNILLKKLNKPLATDIVVIFKDELIQILVAIKQFITSLKPDVTAIGQLETLYQSMQRHNIRVDKWSEYIELITPLDELRTALQSYSPQGVYIYKNRRFSIYSKMLKKYFANEWDITTYGTTFELTRRGSTMQIKDIINEGRVIDEAPLPADWDKDVYTPNTSYKKRIDYAVARAQKLGKGSARTAFDIPYEGRATVLKVAHNAKGMAQNEAEAELLSDGYIIQTGITIPIIDYDEEHQQPIWIHMEKATKATEKQLCQLMKCGKLTWLVDAANTAQGNRARYHNLNAEIIKLHGEDGLETFHEYVNLLQQLSQFDINLADFARAANWGIYQGRPVVIDVGFTQAVGQEHYGLREDQKKKFHLR